MVHRWWFHLIKSSVIFFCRKKASWWNCGIWGSFVKLVGLSSSFKDGWCITAGYIHNRLKKLVLYQFGHLNLREKLLPEVEEMVNQALSNLRSLSFVEVKQACAMVRSSLNTNFLVHGLEVIKYMSFEVQKKLNYHI